jgi:RNA recognition motif-containing protein
MYNLPYSVNQQAIKDHLASAGTVDRCVVKEDRQRPSKYKLTAVATFRTPEQAQTAIERFNGSSWKDCEIKVKLDRGTVSTSASAGRKGKLATEAREGPLVINGSGPSLSSRHSRIETDDDDDDSSYDE